MRRLAPEAGELIDRGRQIRFALDGRPVSGYQGDTIASALAAAGQVIFSRSFKYHRPRGLLCCSGKCPNCLMTVDGVPNVRACTEPAREGIAVRSQNAWPSLERDAMSLVQRFDFLLPVGFYYKMFSSPRWAWKLVEPMIRRMAGLGRIGDDAPVEDSEHVHLRTEVAVIGGGPAGMSAALAAAEAGASVVLIDNQPALGGHLRYQRRPAGEDAGPGLAASLASRIAGQPGIQVFSNALAFGAYEGGLLAIRQHHSLIHLRAGRLIVATGDFEYPPVFQGNDLPGVMLASGVRRLIHLYRVQPGSEAVVAGSDDDALALAHELAEAGIAVKGVADSRAAPRSPKAPFPVWGHSRVVGAEGGKRLRKVVIESGKQQRTIPCDLLVLASHQSGSLELLRQRGVRCEFDEQLQQMTPREHPPGIFSAGRLSGIRRLDLEMLSGRLAGLDAAAFTPQASNLEQEISGLRTRLRIEEGACRSALARGGPRFAGEAAWQFVCFCEDVQQKDITQAIREGFDHLETLKRYSTVSMGPCQGRMCLANAIALCGLETGRTALATGSTTARPPVEPVPLGLLAGAHHEPVKRSPMHHKHLEARASQMNMGEWKRPHTYTSQQQEWRAVRERAGLIDVSTLGKLDLKGKDAPALLDKVYTHSFSGLKPGRVRYGILCNDEGIILDDGTVSRLAEDHYFITTTTGNVDFVEGWLGWWLAGSGECAHVTNVTADFAAVNLAGPRARDTLSKLTPLDLSSAAFPYLACRRAEVAGVQALLLRIGFVGETGWEIHFPAGHGEYVWDAILEAGAEFGIQPFGVETQRILRLEKKHVIIGQDTDALSNPLEADLAWCLKFDKPDFIGKPGLKYLQGRPAAQKLVGFIAESSEPVPEGSVVVAGGRPAGRVTSCRISPHLGKCIGLAWAPVDASKPGDRIEIRSNGFSLSALVVHEPFYDPEGRRLRE